MPQLSITGYGDNLKINNYRLGDLSPLDHEKIEQEKKVQQISTDTILDNKKESKSEKKPKIKIDKESFEEKIKDYTKIEGLFTFYLKEDENKAQ